MAKRCKWSHDDLVVAVQDIREGKTSFRKAEAAYGIPKSTLHDYASGKVEIGSKPGPMSVLTLAEEETIVKYAVEMSKIGYGRTREQILEIVKKIIDKDGRPNPFRHNRPGRKLWKLFLRRHPQLLTRVPEALQLARARCCTPDIIYAWYTDFDQFLQVHAVKDNPLAIWNADEAGFPLCPKTGKVLALRNSKNVYAISGDSKEQITCLCAASAAGEVLPPMHIFAGERFRYNPMKDAVPGAYFGRSPNGWISTELFYGWVANHYARHVRERPVVLLVDGHTCHIDIEVSKFCRDNGILLYCLPAHSSHLTQPLDVGFFKPLKNNWSKACDDFRLQHPGKAVSKDVFAAVFKQAWLATVKVSIIVNAFRESGTCPFNPDAIDKSKLAPSVPFSMEQPAAVQKQIPKTSAELDGLALLEKTMKPATVERYEERYREGYDLETDELFIVWSKFKAMTISDDAKSSDTDAAPSSLNAPLLPSKQRYVSPALDDILTYPEPTKSKRAGKPTSEMPKHLSSTQVIQFLENKKHQKQKAEQEKAERKAERERKRKEREEEKQRKLIEREKKKELAAKRRIEVGIYKQAWTRSWTR